MSVATVSDMLAALTDAGLQAAQFEWPEQEAPPLPYAILQPQDEQNLVVDGRNVLWLVPYDIQLYTRERDVSLELRVKAALAERGIQSSRSFVHDPDNHFCITYFHVTLREQEG
jgi:hypothetical protein